MLRPSSSGDIYSSAYPLYFLISTFSTVTPTPSTFPPWELIWTEWKFSVLICCSQEISLDVRSIQCLLLFHELFWLPRVKHGSFLTILIYNLESDFSKAEPEKPVLTRSCESEVLTCGRNTAPDISKKCLFISSIKELCSFAIKLSFK